MRSTAGVVREYTLKRQNILDNFKYVQMNLNLDQNWRLYSKCKNYGSNRPIMRILVRVEHAKYWSAAKNLSWISKQDIYPICFHLNWTKRQSFSNQKPAGIVVWALTVNFTQNIWIFLSCDPQFHCNKATR